MASHFWHQGTCKRSSKHMLSGFRSSHVFPGMLFSAQNAIYHNRLKGMPSLMVIIVSSGGGSLVDE